MRNDIIGRMIERRSVSYEWLMLIERSDGTYTIVRNDIAIVDARDYRVALHLFNAVCSDVVSHHSPARRSDNRVNWSM